MSKSIRKIKKKKGGKSGQKGFKYRALDASFDDDAVDLVKSKIKNSCGELLRADLREKYKGNEELRNMALEERILGAQAVLTEHAPLFGNLMLT